MLATKNYELEDKVLDIVSDTFGSLLGKMLLDRRLILPADFAELTEMPAALYVRQDDAIDGYDWHDGKAQFWPPVEYSDPSADELDDWWTFDCSIEATDKIKQELILAKTEYYDSYSTGESIDRQHQQNYFAQLDDAHQEALLDLPPSSTDIADWIIHYLQPVVIYTSNSSILYKGKTGLNGTLFQPVSESISKNFSDDDFEPAVVIGTHTESFHEKVRNKFKRVLIRRGLRYWTIEDHMSWANEQYALLLAESPDEQVNWYVKGLVWKMRDEYERTQTRKYKNSNEREVELVYKLDEDFPIEDVTVEHFMTTDQYQQELTKTQIKTYNDVIDWAQQDQPMPKTLKQRVARLPKVDEAMTVERVTRYNDQPAIPQMWDIRGSDNDCAELSGEVVCRTMTTYERLKNESASLRRRNAYNTKERKY